MRDQREDHALQPILDQTGSRRKFLRQAAAVGVSAGAAAMMARHVAAQDATP